MLRALAPRLSARTDTFRIRAYGEVTDSNGNIIAKAMCEAVVQRLPEYVDVETDPDINEPWDEYDPDAAANNSMPSTRPTVVVLKYAASAGWMIVRYRKFVYKNRGQVIICSIGAMGIA